MDVPSPTLGPARGRWERRGVGVQGKTSMPPCLGLALEGGGGPEGFLGGAGLKAGEGRGKWTSSPAPSCGVPALLPTARGQSLDPRAGHASPRRLGRGRSEGGPA